MKNILLIGASGFVGSAILSEALERGFRVTAIVRHPEKMTALIRDPAKLTIRHPNLNAVSGNASSADEITCTAKGMDVVISAYNPGWKNPNIYQEILATYPAIIAGTKRAGVGRLLVVGGAGSLNVTPGRSLIESGQIPASLLPGVKGQAEVYSRLLIPEKKLDWVFFSPSAELFSGKRTGNFRFGKDDLIVDGQGQSRISVQDYAAAMIDEMEHPAHHRERFTAGY